VGDLMKTIPLAITLTTLILIFVSSGLVSALSQNEASVSMLWSKQQVNVGEIVTVRLTFTSNSAEQLRIYRIGFHFDWMPENQFYTSDFTSNPVTIPSQGTHVFEPMTIQIPPHVSAGSHSYFVGIDGTEGTSLQNFSWDSPISTIQIVGAGTPTSTDSPEEPVEVTQSLTFYIAITAVVIVVALLLIIIIMRKRRKPANSTFDQPIQPDQPIEPAE
jgi:hypothetical protein